MSFSYNRYSYFHDKNILTTEYDFSMTFHGELISIKHTDKFIVPEKFSNNVADDFLLDKLVFNLGMVESISYWKATCSKTYTLKCHSLTKEQSLWWKNLFYYGLGEFRYKNNIHTEKDDFIEFEFDQNAFTPEKTNNTQASTSTVPINQNHIIVPVGGGKDSIVTMEELRQKHTIIPFVININRPISECIAAAGISMEDTIVVERKLDKKILEMNNLGALNGHTPFSAMVAFATLIAAELTNVSKIALSNELSANESTVVNNAHDIINHQYSKSFKFEKDFRYYYQTFISDKYNYFSYLRNIPEIRIAEKFSQYKKYHTIFRSCNVGSKNGNVWCGNCPKCLFVYTMLLPFLTETELIDIFGSNLLLNNELKDTLFQLTGIYETKPFECVGTIDETRSAISKYLENNKPMGILKDYVEAMDESVLQMDRINFHTLMTMNNTDNFIPEDL